MGLDGRRTASGEWGEMSAGKCLLAAKATQRTLGPQSSSDALLQLKSLTTAET